MRTLVAAASALGCVIAASAPSPAAAEACGEVITIPTHSGNTGEDGLAGFRTAPEHADDLGKVIADVRARTKAPVWLVGTSRGAISAANAASRLSGPPAPDGLVLISALMSGGRGGAKP